MSERGLQSLPAALRMAANALLVATLAGGCAGGWRNGGPPGTSQANSAAPAATAGTGASAATSGPITFVWKGGGNQVFLGGSFNEWKPDAEPMVKQTDGSFTLSRELPPGKYEYKFVVDGTWKEDPTAKEFTTDPYGGKNSVIVVGSAQPGVGPGAAAGGAGTATSSGPIGTGKPPQNSAEGVTFTFAGAANTVALAGDFNAWAINADPMTKQADGSWTITRKLAPGTYNYKFLVNGTVWKHDDANPEARDDPYGGKNSVVIVK